MSSDDCDDDQVIVIDNGSYWCKAGFAGDKTVSCCVPSIVGKMLSEEMKDGRKYLFVGEEAQAKQEMLDLTYPIQRGVISDFENMEKIWQHIFEKELRVPCIEECSVLMSESPTNSHGNRDKMAEIMFEKFNVAKLYIATQPLLVLLANARDTGVILDSGDGITHAVSINNFKIIRDSVTRLELGACDLTEYLFAVLKERGAVNNNERLHMNNIKTCHCYIPLDYEQELQAITSSTSFDKSYEMPDGRRVKLGEELIKCPELLFKPSILREDLVGIHETTHNSILKSPVDIQESLYSNILIAGGNTMFSGISERMQKEMSQLAPEGTTVKVIAPPERLKSGWLGGSILGSLSFFQENFITKKQYEEKGKYEGKGDINFPE